VLFEICTVEVPNYRCGHVSLLSGFSANIEVSSVLPARVRPDCLCTMRILLVEDHDRLAQSIVRGLDEFGFRVDSFVTAEDGIGATRSAEYDALILDLGLPAMPRKPRKGEPPGLYWHDTPSELATLRRAP